MSDQRHHVRWLFHATAMVRDYESSRDALQDLAGLRVLEDTAIEDPTVGRRGGMAWLGDTSLELGEPRGDASPVQGFIDRFGPGLHSIGLQVEDLDATVAHLAALDVRVVARNDEFAFIFCDPRDTEGLLIQFASVEMPFDPRFGGEIPDGPTPLLPVNKLAWVAASVANPATSAPRLAEIFGTTVTFTEPTRAGIAIGDNTLLLTTGPTDARPRWSSLGLLVPNLAEATAILDAANWPDPTLAGEVPIQLVDHLLPHDPRL